MNENTEQITYNENNAIFRINPEIYPLDIIYSAAYIMIDKAFILLDKDADNKIKITIQNKNKYFSPKQLVQEFNDELLNYAVYKVQSEKNKDLREILLKRVLITNEVIDCVKEIEKELFMKNMDDSEGIFKPWKETEDENNKTE